MEFIKNLLDLFIEQVDLLSTRVVGEDINGTRSQACDVRKTIMGGLLIYIPFFL
jgi:hypothetical protein